MHPVFINQKSKDMNRTVKNVTDGDTFTVIPEWEWNGDSGEFVRANGYNAPEKGDPGYQEATRRLQELIGDKKVRLEPITFTYGRLLCDVFINGMNLKDFFPEYQ